MRGPVDVILGVLILVLIVVYVRGGESAAPPQASRGFEEEVSQGRQQPSVAPEREAEAPDAGIPAGLPLEATPKPPGVPDRDQPKAVATLNGVEPSVRCSVCHGQQNEPATREGLLPIEEGFLDGLGFTSARKIQVGQLKAGYQLQAGLYLRRVKEARSRLALAVEGVLGLEPFAEGPRKLSHVNRALLERFFMGHGLPEVSR